MRSRDVVGHKIVAVRHRRWYSHDQRKWVNETDALILDNGSEIRFCVEELIGDYAVECVVAKANERR